MICHITGSDLISLVILEKSSNTEKSVCVCECEQREKEERERECAFKLGRIHVIAQFNFQYSDLCVSLGSYIS